MDQNDPNKTNQSTDTPQPTTPPQEPVTSVQQPEDAQAVQLTPEKTDQAPASESTPATPPPPATDTTPPPATPPADEHPHNNTMVMIAAVFGVLMLLGGGVVYMMGMSNQTQRLGMEIQKPRAISASPTVSPTPLAEEQELESLDLGDPEKELQELDTQLNTLQ